jgi:TRAP-type C4-dicarboxylate transport system permease small subunit
MRVANTISRALFVWGGPLVLAAMTILVSVDVLLRAAFSRGFIWTLDVTGILLLVFFFLILPWSWRINAHVRMDIVYNVLSSGRQRFVDLLGTLGALVFVGAIGWRALADLPSMVETGVGSSTVSIPHWPVSLLIGVVCVLCVLSIAGALTNPPEPGQEGH